MLITSSFWTCLVDCCCRSCCHIHLLLLLYTNLTIADTMVATRSDPGSSFPSYDPESAVGLFFIVATHNFAITISQQPASHFKQASGTLHHTCMYLSVAGCWDIVIAKLAGCWWITSHTLQSLYLNSQPVLSSKWAYRYFNPYLYEVTVCSLCWND